MSDLDAWRPKLHAFFDQRARAVTGVPTHEELCYIAGRDPRIWLNPEIREDLKRSILDLSGATAASRVLEVGSAAGFLAQIIAPHVGAFTGVDLAEEPLVVARRLGLPNATFLKAEGENLRFGADSFDAVFCYDVFTNFPNVSVGAPLIRDMLRVVRPGGKVLVGSIPDKARVADLPARIAALQQELDAKYGPLPVMPDPVPPPSVVAHGADAEAPVRKGLLSGMLTRLFGAKSPVAQPGTAPTTVAVTPEIVCYEFSRQDFVDVGKSLGVRVEIHEIHPLNPYVTFRFNAVFTKAA